MGDRGLALVMHIWKKKRQWHHIYAVEDATGLGVATVD